MHRHHFTHSQVVDVFVAVAASISKECSGEREFGVDMKGDGGHGEKGEVGLKCCVGKDYGGFFSVRYTCLLSS